MDILATWMNYLRNIRPKAGLKLAVGGTGAEVQPGDAEIFTGRDEATKDGDALWENGNREDGDREELTATGKETIYQGILWMKEKYEQYREQADRRYEQLRQELGRSELRYQELLSSTGQHKNIDELEAQLREERMKVEELVKKLQANSALILRIYRELENIPELGK